MSDQTQTTAQPPRATGLDGFFQISRRGSTVGREVRGGVVNFLTMAYIIVLNPLILGFVPGRMYCIDHVFEHNGLRLDRAERRVSLDGKPLALTYGGRRIDRASTDEQLLIICDALRETRQPALALATLSSPTVRNLAGVVRRAIARFRLANPHTVELSPPERDALRRRAGAVSFTDDLADPARGVSMPGALVVEFLDRDDYYRLSPRRTGSHRPVGAGDGLAGDSGRPGSAS